LETLREAPGGSATPGGKREITPFARHTSECRPAVGTALLIPEALEHRQTALYTFLGLCQIPPVPCDHAQLVPGVGMCLHVANAIRNRQASLEADLSAYQIAAVARHDAEAVPGVLGEL
jgi:hypothetical protein